MSELDPTVVAVLDRHFPVPSRAPDWSDVRERASIRRRHRRRIVALVAAAFVVAAVPTLAFSHGVRQLFGLTAPAPRFDEARLLLAVPDGQNTVRLWVAPSTKGGQCSFVQITPRGSSTKPTMPFWRLRSGWNGGSTCSLGANPQQSSEPGFIWTLTRRGESRRGVLAGIVLGNKQATRVELHWTGGSRRLALNDRHFLTVQHIYFPSKSLLPFEIVAYDNEGSVIARSRIARDLLYPRST